MEHCGSEDGAMKKWAVGGEWGPEGKVQHQIKMKLA
jgi:hypothetical protein